MKQIKKQNEFFFSQFFWKPRQKLLANDDNQTFNFKHLFVFFFFLIAYDFFALT